MRSRAALSSEQMAVGVLFVVLAVLATMVKAQSDTWWQLRSGQEIWETRHVTFVDSYSYTARGQYWPNHEWLTEVIFYGVHRAGGMPLLALFCATAICGAHFLSWRLSVGRFELRFALFVLSLTAAVGAWSMRPQVVTLLCFMLTCTLIVRDRLWWLPPLFLVWANFHGGVGLGLIALGAVGLSDAITERRLPLRVAAVGLVCFAATAMTPMGVRLWELLVAYGRREKTRGISEWMVPGLPPEFLAFWVIAALLIALIGVRWRALDPLQRRLVVIALATLALALGAHRNVTAFLLIAVPAVTALLGTGPSTTPARGARDFNVGNGVLVGALAAAAGLFVLWTWAHPPARLNWTPLAPEAVDAIAACPQPIYNSLATGGLLIGFVPGQPVFIDNRNDPFPVALLEANLRLEQSGDYESLFKQYGVQCAIVEAGSLTGMRLEGQPGWTAVYKDPQITVFERN